LGPPLSSRRWWLNRAGWRLSGSRRARRCRSRPGCRGLGGRSCRRRGRGGTRPGLCRFQIIELFLQILDLPLVLLLEASDLGLVLLLDCCDFGLVFLLDCSDRVLQLSDLITHIRRSLGYSGHR
jgi:hypothetical protein